jgi:hypothetical protein
MAASFYTASGNDLFLNQAGGATSLISIPAMDGIIGETGLAVYNEVSVQLGETLQYFLTFDDVIKFIHFGKGLGNILVNGSLFSDCSDNMPGLQPYFGAFSEMRGEVTTITIGGRAFTVVVSNANLTIVSEPTTMAQFQFAFSVVNHNL